jgi:hypothetical protein
MLLTVTGAGLSEEIEEPTPITRPGVDHTPAAPGVDRRVGLMALVTTGRHLRLLATAEVALLLLRRLTRRSSPDGPPR